jgi:hypothetical protein
MSEEKEGFFSNLKNQIITGAGVALTTIGTVFVDEIKSIIGIADEEPVEQVQPAIENKQETNVNVAGPEIIINIPEQKPAEKTVVIKEVPVEKKQPPKKTETEKRKEEGIDW